MRVNKSGGMGPLAPKSNKDIKMILPNVHQLPSKPGKESKVELPKWVLEDLAGFATAFQEHLNKAPEKDIDPSEAYVNHITQKILSKGDILKGYKVLIEEIGKDKPPPGADIV